MWFVDKLGPRPGSPPANGAAQANAAQTQPRAPAQSAPQQRAAAPPPAPEPEKKKKKGWWPFWR